MFGRVENVVGKGEIAGYQHFLLFPHFFSKAIFSGAVKSGNCMVMSVVALDVWFIETNHRKEC